MSDAAEGRSAADRGYEGAAGGESSRDWGGLDSGGWGGTPSWGGEARTDNRAQTNADLDSDAAKSTADSRQSAIDAGSHVYGGFARDKANLDDDAAMAKAMWAGLTKEEREAVNEHLGRPADYGNSEDDGKLSFKDKLFDMTNPGYKSKAYALGIRGMGATFDTVERQEALNPNLKDARFDALTGIAKNLADLATPAPMKAAMVAARALDAWQNDKMSAVDAVKNAAFEIGIGPALGMVNRGLYDAMGPSAYAGYSAVNKAIGLANLGGANVPTLNSAIAGGVRNALGVTGFGPQTGVTDASGAPANPAGGHTYEGVGGGWGSTGGNGTVNTPTVSVQAPSVSVPGYDYQSSRTDLDGTAFGRSMRNNVINRFSRSQP